MGYKSERLCRGRGDKTEGRPRPEWYPEIGTRVLFVDYLSGSIGLVLLVVYRRRVQGSSVRVTRTTRQEGLGLEGLRPGRTPNVRDGRGHPPYIYLCSLGRSFVRNFISVKSGVTKTKING